MKRELPIYGRCATRAYIRRRNSHHGQAFCKPMPLRGTASSSSVKNAEARRIAMVFGEFK